MILMWVMPVFLATFFHVDQGEHHIWTYLASATCKTRQTIKDLEQMLCSTCLDYSLQNYITLSMNGVKSYSKI